MRLSFEICNGTVHGVDLEEWTKICMSIQNQWVNSAQDVTIVVNRHISNFQLKQEKHQAVEIRTGAMVRIVIDIILQSYLSNDLKS